MSGTINTIVAAMLVGSVALGVTAAVGSSTVGPPHQPATDAQDATSPLVVDDDGSAEYESIQAAVDAASTGDTVEVRPGTYSEQVEIDVTITLVAPEGATLDGEPLPGEAAALTITSGSGAEPVVEALTITDFYDGFVANNTAGGWSLRNVTLENNRNDAVVANRAGGAWTIRSSTIRNNGDEGIEAENTTGSWTVSDTAIVDNEDDALDADGRATTADWTLRNATVRRNGQDAIDVDNNRGSWTISDTVISGSRIGLQIIGGSGDWTIRNTVIRNMTGYGIYASHNDGDWSIRHSHFRYNVITAAYVAQNTGAWEVRNTTIRDSNIGIFANGTTGAWSISHSSIRDTSVPEFDLEGEGTGVYVVDSTGDWRIHRSNLVSHPRRSINATGTDRTGNATHNWWGAANGPTDGDCVGGVDCADALSSPAAVPDPPTAGTNFESDPVSNDGSGIGWRSYAIIGSLFVVLVGLLAVARRQT